MAKEENEVKDAVRIEADSLGMFLYRNQSGAGKFVDKNGERFIRFGLANESRNLNKVLKSGDLIGAAPLTITQEMVGKTIAVFASVELKKPGWEFGDSKQDEGQEAWREHIERYGGFAVVISDPTQFRFAWYDFIAKLKRSL